jgi:hypothetical protein
MHRTEPLPAAPAGTGDGASGGRGAPGRVAAVHRETRRGLALAAVFAGSAVVTAVADVGVGWWLPLHLFVVGALLSAISATTQMLAVTWSASPPTRRVVAGAQRWILATGAVVFVIGRETDRAWMFVTGAAMVVIAMLALAAILVGIRRHAVTDRFAPAIDAYVAAVFAGVTGMSIGTLLGVGRGGARTAELRDTHLVLNVFGLVGLVVAGTLPFFAATQVRSKMSSRATLRAMRVIFLALATAVAVAAAGAILGRSGVLAVGLVGYAAGLVLIAAMLPVYSRARLRWAGPRLLQLLAGLAWWVAMTVALAVAALRGTADREILQALVIGGFAQILVASLAYLGPVLRGGGHRQLTAGFTITRSWVSLAAGNTAAVAALVGHGPTLGLVSAVWLVDVAARALLLHTGRPSGAHV